MTAAVSVIDAVRLWDDVMSLAAITDPGRPYTRRSFSARFLQGRDWLRQRFEATGMTVRLDAAANMIARLEGSVVDAQPIMLGSHSDTVPSGGRFDGTAGILAALEAVRGLKAEGFQPRHPIEIVDFLAEEPSDYGISCVGSRAMAGALDERMLACTDARGETLSAAIARVGGDPAQLASARRSHAAGYLELHIEQGAVLQQSGIDLGIVTSIAGIARIEVIFVGSADHAGTTPMSFRRDAGLAAAALSLFAAERAHEFAARGEGHFVATTGVLSIEPNAANVVPGRARMIFDIRAEAPALLDEFIALLQAESAVIAARRAVDRAAFTILTRTDPVPCSDHLRDLLARSAEKLNYSTLPLASGAGHDAAFVARFAPSAMLFIPCRDGKSHTPEEWAEPPALAAGAATLLEAIRLMDGRNA
jgi:N-carbamoyl-L-amino-acid hydrolase